MLAAGVGAVDAGVGVGVIIVAGAGAGAPDAVESAAASCASELLQFEARSVYVSKVIQLVSPTAKEDNDVSRATRKGRGSVRIRLVILILMLIRVLFLLRIPFLFLPLFLLLFLSGIVIPQRVNRHRPASST